MGDQYSSYAVGYNDGYQDKLQGMTEPGDLENMRKVIA